MNLQQASESIVLSTALGYEIAQLLNLKTDKAGKIKTEQGMLSIQQLGAKVRNILKEQERRITE